MFVCLLACLLVCLLACRMEPVHTCGARITSGYAAFRAILRRSLRELVVPKAQQEPQYCGICWLRVSVKKLVPFTSPQKKSAGKSSVSICSCALGFKIFSPSVVHVSNRQPFQSENLVQQLLLWVVQGTTLSQRKRQHGRGSKLRSKSAGSAEAYVGESGLLGTASMVLDVLWCSYMVLVGNHGQVATCTSATHALSEAGYSQHSRCKSLHRCGLVATTLSVTRSTSKRLDTDLLAQHCRAKYTRGTTEGLPLLLQCACCFTETHNSPVHTSCSSPSSVYVCACARSRARAHNQPTHAAHMLRRQVAVGDAGARRVQKTCRTVSTFVHLILACLTNAS